VGREKLRRKKIRTNESSAVNQSQYAKQRYIDEKSEPQSALIKGFPRIKAELIS